MNDIVPMTRGCASHQGTDGYNPKEEEAHWGGGRRETASAVALRYIYLCVVSPSIVFLKPVRCPMPEIIDHGDEADGWHRDLLVRFDDT